jgi:Nucleoside 2-deoxyribosyltransferase.
MMKVGIVNFDTQYLAHPTELRDEAKSVQERLEQLGVTVINPFDRPDFDPNWNMKSHAPEEQNRIVERDLKWIRESDAVFAYIPQERVYGR